jgi:S1-C subfamily serine protease
VSKEHNTDRSWATGAEEPGSFLDPASWHPPSGEPAAPAPRKQGGWRAYTAVIAVALVLGAAAGAVVSAALGGLFTNSRTVVFRFPANTSILPQVGSTTAILRRVLPAVVGIRSVSETSAVCPQLGGGTQVDEGTGMIVSPGGEVLTNNHVIAGAVSIRVSLYGRRRSVPASVVGTDQARDIAVLRIDTGTRLPTVRFGSSAATGVGDDVLAVGNALGLALDSPSVTEGIVSAKGRTIVAGDGCRNETLTGMLQTDAAINPGNSGGPLLNSAGKVVGMNTAVATDSPGNAPAENIGFAIPIDNVKPLLAHLRRGAGRAGRGYVGVVVESPDASLRASCSLPARPGAVVVGVAPATPAQRAGIDQCDLITSVDGRNVGSARGLTAALRGTHAGDVVRVGLYRAGRSMVVDLRLGAFPAT